MRRFFAYLCMVLSLVVMVVFNIQAIYDSNNLSIEYSSSKEAVIQLTKRDGGINLEKDVVSTRISSRLDLTGINDAKIEVVGDDSLADTMQVRITLATNSNEEYNNVLRILTANTNNLTFSNANDDYVSGSDILGNEDEPMILAYTDGVGVQPRFVIGNTSKWNELTSKNDTIEDENLKKTIYVWENKTDEDTYDKAFGNADLGVQAVPEIRSKIIATLSTDNFFVDTNSDDGIGYVNLETDEKGNGFTIASARSYVTARNADDYGFNVKLLYDNFVPASLPTNARNLMLIGSGIAVLIMWVGLVIAFGLNGFSAGLSIGVTTMFTLLISNFVGFIFTPVTCLALLIIICLGLFNTVYVFSRIKDEYLKGKSIEKAHYEGYRKASKVNLISSGLLFFVSLFTFFVGKGVIKDFCGYLVIGSILSSLVTYYLTKWQSYWLFTSPTTNTKNALIGMKQFKHIKGIDNFAKHGTIEPSKQKKHNIASLSCLVVTCLAVFGVFLGFGLSSPNNMFNNTLDYSNQYRLDFSFVTDRDVSDSATFISYEDFTEHIDASEDLAAIDFSSKNVVSYTFNRIETTSSSDYDETYTTYISLLLDKELTDEQIATIQAYTIGSGFNNLSLFENQPVEVNYNVCYNGQIEHNNFYFYLASGLIVVFIAALYLIYFGIYACLQVLVSESICYGLAMAILVGLRIPFSSLTSFGIYFALLVVGLSFVPIYQRYRELKKDTKSLRAPIEDLMKLYTQASKEAFYPITVIYLAAIIVCVASMFTSSASLFSAGLIGTICLVIGYFYTMFNSGYDYFFFKRHIKYKKFNFKFLEKRRQKAKQLENSTKNEPRETIIPGLNDY